MLAVLVCAAVTGVVTLALQDSASTQTPNETQSLFATVESRVLSEMIVRSAVIEEIPVATVTSFPSLDASSVVTRQPFGIGDTVVEGDVLVEVSSRPVFLVGGEVPAYRPIHFGDTGADVLQIQGGLERLGFLATANLSGTFDAATATALRGLYQSRWYQLTEATVEEEAQLDAARAALKLAVGSKEEARIGGDIAAFDAASAAVDQARSTFDHLVRVTGPSIPLGEVFFVDDLGPLLIAQDTTSRGSPATGARIELVGATAFVPLNFASSELARLTETLDAWVELTDGTRLDAVLQRGAATGGSDGAESVSTDSSSASPDQMSTWGLVLPSADLGSATSVVAHLVLHSTPGPVIVVPVAALVDYEDGTTTVTKESPDRSSAEQLRVSVGLVAGGYAEINLVGPGQLEVGDRVVIR